MNPSPVVAPAVGQDKEYFKAIGYRGEHFFFRNVTTRYCVTLPTIRWGEVKMELLALAPLSYWEQKYPRRIGCPGCCGSVSWESAYDGLLRQAEAAGDLSPDPTPRRFETVKKLSGNSGI